MGDEARRIVAPITELQMKIVCYKVPLTFMALRPSRALLAAFAVCVSGCGDAAEDQNILDSSDKLFIGASRIFTADSSRGFMFAVPSLEAGTEVDLAQSVELDDAWVFGNADPYFYTATLFDPTLTRWEYTAEEGFVRGPTISFANEGVGGTFTAAFTPLFSPNKSYFVDAASAQVVVWDPESMALLKTIPIPVDGAPGGDFTPTMDIALRDDVLLVTVFWASPDSGWTEFGSFTRIVAIDPNTDQVIQVTDEDRCETLALAGVASDGTSYFSPWDYHVAVRSVYGPGFGASPCALRVVPPSATFAEGYEVDMNALVGGRPAGELTLVNDNQALIHVWHDDLVSATPETWQDQRFEPGYKWYRWNLDENEATELPDQIPTSEGGSWGRLDGRFVTYNATDDFAETTLLGLSDDGRLEPMITVPGWTVQLIRAR